MKLTEKIHLLQIDFEILLGPDRKIDRFVNVLLILGKKITLIDTGVKGSGKILSEYLLKQNRDISEVESIILSHSHPDHIGCVASVKERTKCSVFAHEFEKEWIEDVGLQNRQRPVPGFFKLVDKPVTVDRCISDGQRMIVDDGMTLKFIKSSGHSRGSLNMLFEEDKILFTADSIPLKNDIPNYDDFTELMESLNVIKKNNEFETLLTSWTPPLTDRDEIEKVISEGEDYMKRIDAVVKKYYKDGNDSTLDSCKLSITELGLPSFFVNPIVDKAFRSHLEK